MLSNNTILSKKLQSFSEDEDGSIIVFVVIMFLTMVIACGMAVDFMRHETARADLQNALDRGVLAAAALTQSYVEEKIAADDSLDGSDEEVVRKQYEDLVQEYMDSRVFRADLELDVQVDISATGKIITGDASYNLDTTFLNLLGWTEMTVPAVAVAQQVSQDLELVLVLDVSGSMYNPNNKSSYINDQGDEDPDNDVTYDEFRYIIMQTEAKRFVKYLLDLDLSPGKTKTAISVVPYSHQVALPDYMAKHYAAFDTTDPDHHAFNYCIDFEDGDFLDTFVDPDIDYTQSQSFWYRYNRSNVRVFGCSRDANTIRPYTNVQADLDAAINGLEEEHLTSVYQGVKWGATLLDPFTQPVIQAISAENSAIVPTDFQSLPRAWDADNLQKVMVVISDGENTRQPRIIDTETQPVYSTQPPEGDDIHAWWNSASNQASGSVGNNECPLADLSDSSADANDPIYYANNNNCNNTIGTYLNYNQFPEVYGYGSGAIRMGDARLYEICTAAKAQGITIYTIGFEANANAQRALEICANEGRSYVANGQNLSSRFDEIAADIETLKLTN